MARLDMNHGFIRYITKNQLDRDKYDQEVKQKGTPKARLPSNRPHKAPQALYTAPARADTLSNSCTNLAAMCSTVGAHPGSYSHTETGSKRSAPHTKAADILFTDGDDITYKFRIYSTDDPEEVCSEFCRKRGYPNTYVHPLADKIRAECSQYFHFTGDAS